MDYSKPLMLCCVAGRLCTFEIGSKYPVDVFEFHLCHISTLFQILNSSRSIYILNNSVNLIRNITF